MRKLGKQGPEISVVGYGAWEAGGGMWGENESDERVVAAIHAAIDSGMNWIDTAEVYGKGRSEELVGKALQERGKGEILIFTKVAPKGAGSGIRPEEIKKAIRGSLGRLGVDHVDLYQIHWPDNGVPVEESWGGMVEVAEEGLASHIGVSNYNRALIERCTEIRHVDSVQNELSLLAQEDRGDLLVSLPELGTGYLAYSPLGLGILTGAIKPDTKLSDWRGRGSGPAYFQPQTLPGILEKVEKLRPIADRLATTTAALALRWVIDQQGVTAAIAGSRSADHVRGNATAGDLKLTEDDLREIDSVFS